MNAIVSMAISAGGPCGCGAVIRLGPLVDDRPHLSVRVHSGWAASIYPSVAHVVGCKSHFIIRRGRLIWATWTRPCPSDTDER